MSKNVHKYSLNGDFICTYKSVQQAANDLKVDESTIRKPLKYLDSIVVSGFMFTKEKRQVESHYVDFQPKVLILDIETTPMIAYVWKMWDNNIGKGQLLQDWFTLSWSAKWLFDPAVYSAVVTPEEVLAKDDKRIIKAIWEIINDADVIVGHNCNAFDLPKLNTRFLLHGLPPPKPYQTIDTLLAVKGNTFKFSSNSLAFLTNALNLDEKLDTDFNLWSKCLSGNQESLADMVKYNCQDVIITEELYTTIRPWIKSHPNMNNFSFNNSDERKCNVCSSTDVSSIGTYSALVNQYTTYRCNHCHSLMRSSKPVKNDVGINNRTISLSR